MNGNLHSSSSTVEENFSNISFYNFTKNPIFYLKNIKLEELDFPEISTMEYNLNNLILNKKDHENSENIDHNILYKDNNRITFNNDLNIVKQQEDIKDFNEQNEFEVKYVLDENDYDFFENQAQNNHYYSEKDENINQNCKKKCGNISENYKILSNKNQSSNNKIITKEHFSQQINNICTSSSRNPLFLEFENKIGIENTCSLECPLYDTFSEDNLKEEMKKYGMKPGSYKFMVRQLKEVWQFLNMSIYSIYK